ncbi:hypothetical protein [Devosia sp. 1635]|uniref:hypothetical protein n=1 Tax=Devosia sp. 1635 TaxID=2726066 RepID=UPI0015641C53|nr:hypothetical protein [Devosia sp. 1635]
MDCKSIYAGIALACLAVLPVAFDYSGLRSGMTVGETNAAAARTGRRALEQAENMSGLYTLGSPNQSSINMTFCQDRLFALTSAIQGGVDAYSQIAEDMVHRYGQPLVQPTSQYTEQGLLSSVRMTWPVEGGETVSIDISQYRGSTTSRAAILHSTYCARSLKLP